MILVALLAIALIQDASTPLTGIVVTEDGTPVAGAELILTSAKPAESPVAARGKSGEDGKFRFDRPAAMKSISEVIAPTLWVSAPGRSVSIVKFPVNIPGADEPLKVIMRPASRTEIRVESPDEAPVAGVKLRIQRIKSEPMPLPIPVIDFTERTTGADGMAIIEGFGPDDIGAIDFVAEGFGIQPRWLDPSKPGLKRVRLIAVTSLKGRLVPEKGDETLAKGWRSGLDERPDGGAADLDDGRLRVGDNRRRRAVHYPRARPRRAPADDLSSREIGVAPGASQGAGGSRRG